MTKNKERPLTWWQIAGMGIMVALLVWFSFYGYHALEAMPRPVP